MQARVRNKPDHPERLVLDTELRRMAGPEVSRLRLVTDGDSRWRIGNFGEASQVFLDAAVTQSRAWTLTQSAFETMAADAPQASAVRSQRDSRKRLILELASGKLSDIAAYGLREWTVVRTNAGWDLKAANSALGAEMIFRIERAEPFRVASVEITRSPNPAMLGERTEFVDTILFPAGRPAAKSMRLLRRGTLSEVTTVESVKEITRSDLDRAVAVPSPGGEDYIRGPIRARRMVEWRGDVQAVREYDDTGQFVAAEVDHALAVC